MMRYTVILALCLHVSLLQCKTTNSIRQDSSDVRTFPDGFTFGTSTASYQIEGAWDVDGKAENIWDVLTHMDPSPIKDGSTGDDATNSYYLYKRDVEMMRELGIDFYRFSLSWPRLLPNSFSNEINQAGADYYNNLINEMMKYNITPVVTLYHWDLPQKLQDMGGWLNPSIVDWYGDYARVAFELFGDRVKSWITINEPYQVCHQGYGDVTKAPMLNMKGIGDYICSKNLLMAHAKAWHIYDEQFRAQQEGNIFISFSAQWYEPESQEHAEAASDANSFYWRHYVDPIFSKTGDFPPVVKERVAAKSAAQGYPRSRLPELTPQEIEYIRGTSDYFGLNHYISYYVYRNESVINFYEAPSFLDDLETTIYQLPEWNMGASTFNKYVPWGFYNLLTFIREEYENPPIYITENGFATHSGLQDHERVTYYRGYLGVMLDAMEEGSDIRGYTAWSLMDNFEWMQGYVEKFGFYEVDLTSPERTRTPRLSAFVYKNIIKTRTLDLSYEPDTDVMSIDKGH